MKLSEVRKSDVVDYIRSDDGDDSNIIDIIMSAAKSFVAGQTGLTDEELDQWEDITAAYLVLCAEMYDNRQLTVSNDKQNPMVRQILASHSVNYL